jgi:hypothetical protein
MSQNKRKVGRPKSHIGTEGGVRPWQIGDSLADSLTQKDVDKLPRVKAACWSARTEGARSQSGKFLFDSGAVGYPYAVGGRSCGGRAQGIPRRW